MSVHIELPHHRDQPCGTNTTNDRIQRKRERHDPSTQATHGGRRRDSTDELRVTDTCALTLDADSSVLVPAHVGVFRSSTGCVHGKITERGNVGGLLNQQSSSLTVESHSQTVENSRGIRIFTRP